jgi:hypothetical protein
VLALSDLLNQRVQAVPVHAKQITFPFFFDSASFTSGTYLRNIIRFDIALYEQPASIKKS